MFTKQVLKILFLGAALLAVGEVQADVIPTIVSSSSASQFSVSNSDLLQATGTTASYTSGVGNKADGSVSSSVLTDGNLGTNGTTANSATGATASHPDTCAIASNSTATYTFDTTTNSGGYTITNVNIYSSWSDKGRNGMNVVVSYSTVADPTTYTVIGTAAYGNNWDSTGLYNAAYFTTNLTGVKSIRFSFGTQQNGYAGYNELDVIVAATVPEPSTTALGLMGAASLLAYGWRRRRRKIQR